MSNVHPGDDRLIDYALSELDRRGREQIEAHLEECEACRRIVATLSSVIRSTRAVPQAEPPARMLVDLLEAQAETGVQALEHRARAAPASGSERGERFPRLATAAAAVFLIGTIFAGGFVTGRRTTGTPVPVAGAVDTLRVVTPLPEPPEIPFQTAHASEPASLTGGSNGNP